MQRGDGEAVGGRRLCPRIGRRLSLLSTSCEVVDLGRRAGLPVPNAMRERVNRDQREQRHAENSSSQTPHYG
jgi:hypothetical protein